MFGAALLCAGLENASLILLVSFFLPLLGLAVWLHFPFVNALFLTFGCGGVFTLIGFAFQNSRIAQQNLLIALSMPMVELLAGGINGLIAHITTTIGDAELLNLDHGVSSAIYMWTVARTWRLVTAYAVYVGLPAVVALGVRFTIGRARVHLLRALCLAPILAVFCYLIMPAVGPVHIGQPSAWRNCMPSLHLTWAALLWLNAHPRWWKAASFLFALLTAYATLATGEHYWVDLVAAISFTLGVQWLSEPSCQEELPD